MTSNVILSANRQSQYHYIFIKCVTLEYKKSL